MPPAYKTRPAISLILATIGDDDRLAHLFESLRSQTFRSFEAIVVDQSGDERVRRVIDAHGAGLDITHVRHARGLSRSRNAGLRIDHLLLNRELAARLAAAGVDKAVRGRAGASDHAPAWIEIKRA